MRARVTWLAADAVSLLAAVVLYIFAAGVVKGFALRAGPLHARSTSWCCSGSPSRWCSGWAGSASSTAGAGCPGSAPRRSGSTVAPTDRGGRLHPASGREGLMGRFAGSATSSTPARSSIDFVGQQWPGTPSRALVVLAVAIWPDSRAWTSASSSPAAPSTRCPWPPVRGHAGQRRRAPRGGRRRRHQERRAADRHDVRQQLDPRPDRGAHRRGERPGHARSSSTPSRSPRRDLPGRDRRQLGQGGRRPRHPRSRRLPRAGGAVHLGLLPRMEDVAWRRSSRWPTTSSSRSASTRCPASRSRPATVTGLLAILGFSLYDTVVVFDKVRENTKNLRAKPPDLRQRRQPGGQPDPGALDQHLASWR